MTKRVQLDISREKPGMTGALCISVITFRTNFKMSNGNAISQTRLPLDEWEQGRAGEIATQVVTKLLEIERCTRVQSGDAYEIRVYPTTAMNDEEYKNFLRQAVAAFVEVYGPIDEFVLAKKVASDLRQLFSGEGVSSTDEDRVFVTRSDTILPAATAN